MMLEPEKRKFVIAAIVIVVVMAGGFLIYNLKGGPATSTKIVEAPVAVTADKIVTVRLEENRFVFERAGEPVGNLPVTTGMKTMMLLRQVGKYAYFKTMPEGGDGYILFGSGSPQVVRVDAEDGSIFILKRDGRRVEDISPNGQFVAWSEYKETGDKQIVVEDLNAKTESLFPIEKKFSQFGDVHFSPDSSKIAFAAAIGFPGKENGIAYVASLKDGTIRPAATTSQLNTYYRVKGWRNATDIDSVLQSGDMTDFKMK